jgi:hypothetical protein
MSVQQLKNDAIDAAQKYKARYKETLDPNDLDMFKRFMDVYNHLEGVGSVKSIVAGDNITISPSEGTGDVTINAIFEEGGYGSFYSTQNQPILVVDVPQIVTLNNTYEASDVSVVDNKILFGKAGTYQFSYVAQVFNSSNDIEHCEFWIKYNDVDYPNSATHITLLARKSSTEPSEQQMKLILTGTAQNDNDYIELYWQGSSVSLQLSYIPPGIDGPVGSPSVIANIMPVNSVGGGGGSSSLDGLSDVLITGVEDGQFLSYNSTTGKWENVTADVSGGGGELDIDGGTFLVPGGGFSFDAGTFI